MEHWKDKPENKAVSQNLAEGLQVKHNEQAMTHWVFKTHV